MAFVTANRVMGRLLPHAYHARMAGGRATPECVVFPARADSSGNGKPVVRVFLGTEPAQHRAERVFIWSIEKVRDRSRRYEIYLMKDLAGFNRAGWATGFTNYRFAIPHFTQGSGRAIYNDVDQIYLRDPGELFDLDMGGHGFLAITDTESSVMLIDCARMAKIWTLEDACRLPRKRLLGRATSIAGLRGPLSSDWNARDEEYKPGNSKLLHFTTLHTQPWRPFPGNFIYEEHPWAEVWQSIERAADEAGAQAFTRNCPSQRYIERLAQMRRLREQRTEASHGEGARVGDHVEEVGRLLAASKGRTLLVYGSTTAVWSVGQSAPSRSDADPGAQSHAGSPASPWKDAVITPYDPFSPNSPKPPAMTYDGVVCLDALDQVPDEDIPWMIEELFAGAHRFVYAAVACDQRPERLPNREFVQCTVRDEGWWRGRFESASKRYPQVHWELSTERGSGERGGSLWWEIGGRFLGRGQPTVWVLIEDRTGNNSQSLGLAEALGWPYELKQVLFKIIARLPNRLLGASLAGITRETRTQLTKPWPDLLIATGRRLAPIARWIKRQSRGRTRLVHLGRKGGHVVDDFDLLITCSHFGLPSHPRRIPTVAPLNPIKPERLSEAAQRWPRLFGDAPRPHVALLVGGDSRQCRLDVDTARRLGQSVREFAEAAGGTAHAVTSRRTGARQTDALIAAMGGTDRLYRWKPGQLDSPYLGYLATADVIVVTGESESMLAETAGSGKPLYIYSLPERGMGIAERLRAWLAVRAHTRPSNVRGTVRPQQGLEYLCARILERGLVLPPRNLSTLHETLVRLGLARRFGEPLMTEKQPSLNEADEVARRVKALLGVDPEISPDGLAFSASSPVATSARA